jgi:hypothetical protein
VPNAVMADICSPKIVFPPQICGGSSSYQAVYLNTRCGTGSMLIALIDHMAMQYER